MSLDSEQLAAFRYQLLSLRTAHEGWEASRHLVDEMHLPATMQQLVDAAVKSSLPTPVKHMIGKVLGHATVRRVKDLPGEELRQLTGLPPTKAVRALCLLFDLTSSAYKTPNLSSADVERTVREHPNPFDLLLVSDVASLLDLGAGDLSFADELVLHYGGKLSEKGTPFVLHCLDRLRPNSQLGGPLHPDPPRLDRLRSQKNVQFRYLRDRDMFDLSDLDHARSIARRYAIATCWAPATPTFAYEPSRLAASIIQDDLRQTKGAFRQVQAEGEPALEVRHRDRTLLFPPWKFDIRGPLALLQLVAMRGSLCVLGAVDSQVFWEILVQLIEDPRARPPDRLLTPSVLSESLGTVYQHLDNLPIGSSLDLSDVTELRHEFPAVLAQYPKPFHFRYVVVRHGAIFPGIPASSTARAFQHMAEESPPWFLTLVPEVTPES
ncbi:MAG: hypothetical protein ABW047_15480 [Nitrospiraceae bacterium]